mgnify:FL=1
MNIEQFINNLQKDEQGYVILNMFDNSILHESFLESALRCSAPDFERKPKKIRYIKNQVSWPGITVFTDKTFHLAPRVECPVKIAWLIEPYDLLPQAYDIVTRFEEHFDFVFTYEKTLIDRDPKKYIFHPCDTSGIELESYKLHEKNKLVSMIYSEKTWLFGHRLRHIVAKSLLPKMKYDKVDLMGRATERPVRLKSESLNDYMFQITIENAKRHNYFADKIYDCFVTATIPIYWGAPNIGDFFDERGILSFNLPNELEKILYSLTEEKYHSMYKYVKKNHEEVMKYLRPDDLLFESIVHRLKERGRDIACHT